MFIDDLKEIPKSVYLVTVVVVIAEPTYTILNTMNVAHHTREDALKALHSFQITHAVVYQEISQIHLDTDDSKLRELIIDKLNDRKKRIMAEKQQELDEVDEAIQNLLALPAPATDEGDVFDG